MAGADLHKFILRGNKCKAWAVGEATRGSISSALRVLGDPSFLEAGYAPELSLKGLSKN